MKRIFSLLGALMLLLCMLGNLPVFAAGSVSVSADKTTVTIGNTVTVTIQCDGGGKGIGSMDAYFHYNTKAFEYQSCTGAIANGSAGTLKLSYFAEGLEGPKSLTVALKFKAIGVGDSGFKWETEGMYDDDDNLLSNTDKSLSVTANNPTKSGDATLAYLRPSKGTLTPKFDKNVTSYTVSVPYTVTRLLLTYDTTHPDATEEITDNADLQVGKTTRIITVTAPNGTVKKYTVTVTREPQQNTTTNQNSTGTGTTTTVAPPPAADALEVTVGGVLMTVSDLQPNVALPVGFKWDYINLNGVDVPAAKNDATGMVLLHLTNELDKTADLYIYYATAGKFELFRPLAVTGGNYVLLDMPTGQAAPNGTVASVFPYEGDSVDAFAYEDTGLADYLIVYATSPAGVTGLYVYDRTDGSLQRYYEQPAIQEGNTQPEEQPDEQKHSAFADFIVRYKGVILTVAAACCGLALLVTAIVFAARLLPGSRKKGKH